MGVSLFGNASSHESSNINAFDGAFVVLGVTGSVAAYKAVEVCRQLIDAGAYVVPVLTKAATRFIGATTFSALASEPAKTELFNDDEVSPHTRLGRAASCIVIAPATASLIAEYAAGISRDLLLATLLCTNAPVILCPAMHTEMWEHPATQENIATLRRRGVIIVAPESGRLAGGDVGVGRLASLETIINATKDALLRRGDLAGLSVLVTAGGTREAIDPVRFIGNRSSGKQGYAIAQQAARRGASVTLITTVDRPVSAGIDVVAVESAAEMEAAVVAREEGADIVIMAAAVADFRPKLAAVQKMKKRDGVPDLVLEETPDILAGLVARRRAGQQIVGFAAETTNVEAEGTKKLTTKGVDLIVINDVTAEGVGFAHDTNAVLIVSASGERTRVPLASKSTIADTVLDKIIDQRRNCDLRSDQHRASH